MVGHVLEFACDATNGVSGSDGGLSTVAAAAIDDVTEAERDSGDTEREDCCTAVADSELEEDSNRSPI